TADVARQRLSYRTLGQRLLGVGIAQQFDGTDQKSRCTEAALQAAPFGEGLPEPPGLLELLETLDRCHPHAVDLYCQHEAGAHTPAVEEYRTRAAHTVLA